MLNIHKHSKGFIPVPILLIIATLVLGGGWYAYDKTAKKDIVEKPVLQATSTDIVSLPTEPISIPQESVRPQKKETTSIRKYEREREDGDDSDDEDRNVVKITQTTQSTTSVKNTASYTLAQVVIHATSTDCWTTINGSVYNVTSYIQLHPGGSQAILYLCGKDGSSAFNGQHGGQARPASELASFKIGVLVK